MGALIVLHALASAPDAELTCDAMILSSPIVGIHEDIPAWKRLLLRPLSTLLPRIRISLEALAGKEEVQVTKDSIHQEQTEHNPYHVPTFTLRLLATLGSMIESSPRCARRIIQPVLILHGGHDILSRSTAVESFAREFPDPEKVTRQFYPESYHLLFYDHQREKVLSDLNQWVHSLDLP